MAGPLQLNYMLGNAEQRTHAIEAGVRGNQARATWTKLQVVDWHVDQSSSIT